MKMHHTPWHWIAVAAVLAIALFTLREAHGQSTGPAAVFEGRPAMSGVQGGLGPMAGLPQGGIGPQTPGDARGGVELPRDPGRPVVPRDGGLDRPQQAELEPRRDRGQNVVPRDRDPGTGMENKRSAGKRVERQVERVRRD